MSFETKHMTDEEIIAFLNKKYDLSKDSDLLEVFQALQNGEIEFHSKMGMEFDDSVYERATKIRQKQRNTGALQSNRNLKEHVPVKRQIQEKQQKGKQKKAEQKKAKKKVVVLTRRELFFRRLFMGTLLTVALVCLGYFSIYCYDAWKTDQESRRLAALKENDTVNDMYGSLTDVETVGEETRYFKVLEKYNSLYHQNKNLIGWLHIADTIIDYPVMQNQDNTYYLDHNINQEEDKNGTLFMDSACDVKKPSTNFIVYGHNMRSGKMFGSLDKYESESFYKKHPTISFDTIYEEGTYEVMYVFRSRIYKQDEVVFKYYQFIDANSEEEFNSNMEEMQKLSLYDTGVTASYGDQLLTLSTCDYEEEDGRFVVVARRVQ